MLVPQVHQFFTACDLDDALRAAAPSSLALLQDLDSKKCRQAFSSVSSHVQVLAYVSIRQHTSAYVHVRLLSRAGITFARCS